MLLSAIKFPRFDHKKFTIALSRTNGLSSGVVYSTRKYMTGSSESKISFPNGLADDVGNIFLEDQSEIVLGKTC